MIFKNVKQNNLKTGFTLVELLVVISIISFLSSIVLASLNTARSKARYVRVMSDMQEVEKALQMYYQDNGRYPIDVQGGQMPVGLGTYLSVWPTPPCPSNWVYDYEAWDWRYPDNPNTIRVSIKDSHSYFYCIWTNTDCGASFNTGGQPIQNITSKMITCNE